MGLLRAVALLLLAAGRSGSSSSHSLRYFFTGVSEPVQGLPQFIIVGYVDDQPFIKYDSITRRSVPRVSWMEKVVEDEAEYLERDTQRAQGHESEFKAGLKELQKLYNQKNSTEFHTLQWMYSCEVGLDGQLSGGHSQFAYDGEDFYILDIETLTWTACVPQAEEQKRRWEIGNLRAQLHMSYMKDVCVPWLRRHLDYGKETLMRTEQPTARVSRKEGHDGRETLFCQLYGFYPKEIEVTWMKDGEDRTPETLTGGVTPNSDGTYHTWFSINVDPKERDRYRCRVGHDSLPKPLDLAWEEPASNLGLILGIVGAFLAALLVGAGVAFYMRNWKDKGYEAASRGPSEGHRPRRRIAGDKGSSSDNQ